MIFIACFVVDYLDLDRSRSYVRLSRSNAGTHLRRHGRYALMGIPAKHSCNDYGLSNIEGVTESYALFAATRVINFVIFQ